MSALRILNISTNNYSRCIFGDIATIATMNGMGMPFPQPGVAAAPWQEHRTADGRLYYYNGITKVTQWTKPEELMTPAEVSSSSLLNDLLG